MASSMLTATPITSFATDVDTNSLSDIVITTESNTGGPTGRSWLSPSEFSFTGSNSGKIRTVDGRYLAYECKATSSSASYITIKTYVDGTLRDTSNITCNGTTTKVDWIDMQYSGNHDIQFVYTTPNSSQTATVKMTYYSWS